MSRIPTVFRPIAAAPEGRVVDAILTPKPQLQPLLVAVLARAELAAPSLKARRLLARAVEWRPKAAAA
jgi:hypothetical protein